jgi:hypothetical protein
MASKGFYKLCTVNKAPERAKRLIGRMVEDLKDEYRIEYLENVTSTFAFTIFAFLRTIIIHPNQQ